jgi:Cu(I)/Ag(I) efflux system membrane fusion protein/cobalt-zinc-cadmium efflux system membrane fusion protein
MFATVRVHTHPAGESLLVPSEAVIHGGERNLAFVSLGDGRFEPRDLRLGVRGDEDYEVLEGLQEGEQVVTSGQFLLDSESRLKEAVLKMLGSNVAPAGSDAGVPAAAPVDMPPDMQMPDGQQGDVVTPKHGPEHAR